MYDELPVPLTAAQVNTDRPPAAAAPTRRPGPAREGGGGRGGGGRGSGDGGGGSGRRQLRRRLCADRLAWNERLPSGRSPAVFTNAVHDLTGTARPLAENIHYFIYDTRGANLVAHRQKLFCAAMQPCRCTPWSGWRRCRSRTRPSWAAGCGSCCRHSPRTRRTRSPSARRRSGRPLREGAKSAHHCGISRKALFLL